MAQVKPEPLALIGYVLVEEDAFTITGALPKEVGVAKTFEFPTIGKIPFGGGNRELVLILGYTQETFYMLVKPEAEDAEKLYSGLDDVITERTIKAIRLGFLKKDGPFRASRGLGNISPNTPIYKASPSEIQEYLKANSWHWIPRLSQEDRRSLLTVLPDMIRYFHGFNDASSTVFDADGFIQMLLSSEIIDEIYYNHTAMPILAQLEQDAGEEEKINYIGTVTGLKKDSFVVTLTRGIDTFQYPIISVEILDPLMKNTGKVVVGLITNAEGNTIECIKIVGEELPLSVHSRVRYTRVGDLSDALDASKMSAGITKIPLEIGNLVGVELASEGKPVKFKLFFEKNQLNHGIACGMSRSGKSNGIKGMVLFGYHHNKDSLPPLRLGFVVVDYANEYSQLFTQISRHLEGEEKVTFDSLTIIANPADTDFRIPLEQIPAWDLMPGYDSEDREINTQRFMKIAYDKSGLTPPKRGIEFLTPELLTWIHEQEQYELVNIMTEGYLHKQSAIAIVRRLTTLDSLLPVLNVKKVGKKFDPLSADASKHLGATLKKVLKEGLIFIYGVNKLEQSAKRMLTDYINTEINYIRKTLYSNAASEAAFNAENPIVFFVNEEATALFASMKDREVTHHIETATGSAKYNLGVIYVFQSLEKVDTRIISQLGGFNLLFKVTNQKDLSTAIKNIHIAHVEEYESRVRSAPVGRAICSCQTLLNRPFIVDFPLAQAVAKEVFPGLNFEQINTMVEHGITSEAPHPETLDKLSKPKTKALGLIKK